MGLDYATIIENLADALGDRTAIVFGERRTSWRDLEERAARISRFLVDRGLKKDSRVGLLMYNCPEYMEAYLAANKFRGVPININYRYVDEELVYLLRDCEAEALIYHSSLAERVEGLKEELDDLGSLIAVDDGGTPTDASEHYEDLIAATKPASRMERSSEDACVVYTGGTTGMPKGAEYDMGTMMLGLSAGIPMLFPSDEANTVPEIVARAEKLHAEGHVFSSIPCSPLMHANGILLSGILCQLLGGVIVLLTSRSFDPHELWRTVERERVYHVTIVGDAFAKPMVKALLDYERENEPYDLDGLKVISSSGVMFSKEAKTALLKRLDVTIFDTMGATEGGMAAQACSRREPPSDTARFHPFPGTKVFDQDFREIEAGSGKPGLIGMCGNMPRRYHGDEEKTRQTFRIIDGVRYCFTGDMGIIDEDGCLRFLGRGSSCINSGGEKVFPEEVEEVVKRIPGVEDCMIVGIPDDRFGEAVAAVISVAQGSHLDHQELRVSCKDGLASYKIPKTIKLVGEVRRAANGKADYEWARALFVEGEASGD